MNNELIKIEHDLQTGAQKQLNRLIGKISDTRALKKDIGEYLLTATEERFDSQTDPDGEKWQDVKPATRKRKKHPKILTEQGHLRGDVHYELQRDALLLGVGLAYGAIHQLGGEIEQEARTGLVTHFKREGKGQRFSKPGEAHFAMKTDHKAATIKMPARPYLGISRADEKEILEIARDHLEL